MVSVFSILTWTLYTEWWEHTPVFSQMLMQPKLMDTNIPIITYRGYGKMQLQYR